MVIKLASRALLPLRLLFLVSLLLASCSAAIQTSTPSPTVTSSPTRTLTSLPTLTPRPTLTNTPLPTPTSTATKIPVYITTTVWASDPIVPVLAWHQFAPDYADNSTTVKVRLSDFRQELQDLHDAGFTLVSLDAWLHGDLRLAEGRRPLILTMDDLFFNNQISLLDDGTPSPETGIGVLYQFYQEHPDFGLHGALFATLGDKLYANPDLPDWEDKLAGAVAWVTDHDLIPYNHFYLHPKLNELSPRDILWQAQTNDEHLRNLLAKANRSDLITKLGNIFAIPYGIWPSSQAGMEALLNYQNPEGLGVEALMDIDFIDRPKYMLPPYDPSFDFRRVPRIVATLRSIQYLVDNQEQFPRSQSCLMGPIDEQQIGEPSYLALLMQKSVDEGSCPAGIFALNGLIFRADASSAVQLEPVHVPAAP